jgi:hypothetical protein
LKTIENVGGSRRVVCGGDEKRHLKKQSQQNGNIEQLFGFAQKKT